MNYKIKMITGFRRDQEYSIDADEAHKAYYLFLHPDERGIFKNGIAIRGQDIQEIAPDYHGTMGWNPTHNLDNDDWNDMRNKGVDIKLRNILSMAKEVAYLAEPQDISKPLSQLGSKFPQLKQGI